MTGKWEEGGQNLKKREGRQYTGSLYKIRILAPLCQLYKETLKVSHPSHYKPTPPPPHSWLPPISSKNFPTPPITAIFEKFHPPFMKTMRLWVAGFSACTLSMNALHCRDLWNFEKFSKQLLWRTAMVECFCIFPSRWVDAWVRLWFTC